MVILILTIVLVLLVTVLVLLKRSYTYWNSKGVGTYCTFSIFGNARDVVFLRESIGENFRKFYQQCRDDGKPFAGYYLLTKPIFVPIDGELIRRIFTTNFNHFSDRVGHMDEKNDPLSVHLFNLKGERWRFLRGQVSPSFTQGNIRKSYEICLKYAEQLSLLVDGLAGNPGGVDFKTVCKRFTTDVSISFTFGIESDFLRNPNSVFRKYTTTIFGVGFSQCLLFFLSVILPKIYSIFKLRSFDADTSTFFTDLVLKIQRMGDADKHHSVIHKLMSTGTKNGANMTEIVSQGFELFLAIVETNSTAITFLLFEMSLHQGIQEKARREIASVFKRHGQLTYDAVKELEYLQKCILETLRLFPAAPINTRLCTEIYNVPNSSVHLEKGTWVAISHQGINMDPKYFPNPETFDPDRFSEGNIENDTSVFMPFGDGPRKCIGYQFGILEIKVAIAMLLSNFRFTVHPDTKTPIRFSPLTIFCYPVPPIKLNIEKL